MGVIIYEDPKTAPPCQCAKPGCTCDDKADVQLNDGVDICGCCYADCPDVHPEGDLGIGDLIAREAEAAERAEVVEDDHQPLPPGPTVTRGLGCRATSPIPTTAPHVQEKP